MVSGYVLGLVAVTGIRQIAPTALSDETVIKELAAMLTSSIATRCLSKQQETKKQEKQPTSWLSRSFQVIHFAYNVSSVLHLYSFKSKVADWIGTKSRVLSHLVRPESLLERKLTPRMGAIGAAIGAAIVSPIIFAGIGATQTAWANYLKDKEEPSGKEVEKKKSTPPPTLMKSIARRLSTIAYYSNII